MKQRTSCSFWLIAAIVSLIGFHPITADDTDKKEADQEEPELSPGERLNDLMGTYQAEMQKFFKDYRAAETDEERRALKRPDTSASVRAVLSILKEAPDDDASPKAIAWAAQLGARDPNLFPEIDSVIREHFIDLEGLENICLTLSYFDSEATSDLLNHILKNSGNESAKGAALYSLAKLQANQGNNKQAEEYFERVIKEFPEAKARGRSISDMAEGQLFETRNLAIGKVAPEIEGKKADGSDFKLSDYQGKVVVIDFFGHW